MLPRSQHEEWRYLSENDIDINNKQSLLSLNNDNNLSKDFDFQKKYIPENFKDKFKIQVMCSLLSDEHNIAGICRTAECLNIEAVCIPNRALIEQQSFKNMAVSSEKHLPL